MTHRIVSAVLILAVLCLASSPAAAEVDAAPFIDADLPACGIQKAIDSLPAEGGTVVLPEGTFVLMRSIMLRDGVTLKGQGPEKTVLTSKRTNTWIAVTGGEGNTLELERVPDDLTVGTSVFLWSRRPQTGWLGYYVPQVVTAVEGDAITVDGVLLPGGKGKRSGFISYGLCSRSKGPVEKGATALKVYDTSLFVVGGAVAVGSGDGNATESLSFVKAIEGDTLVLERPIRQAHPFADKGFWRRPAVWTLFPLITGENNKNVTIRDLGVTCPIPADDRSKLRRYTLSLIHLYNAQDSLIENVHASNSFTDGISLQTGNDVTVRECVVTGCSGNGFHPGTGLKTSIFEENLARDNGAGLYFCWHNNGHILRRNEFVENRGGGITGLGNPSDRNNVVEDNLIARNGGPGIVVNGDPNSNNVIRKNVIENNSQNAPGKHPAIRVSNNATLLTVEGNTIRDTQEKPTQLVGIAEEIGKRRGKVTYPNKNTYRGNTFEGGVETAIILAGPDSVAEDNGDVVVKRLELPAEESDKTKE